MGIAKTSDADAVRDMYDAEAESYSTMMDSEIEKPMYSDTLRRLHSRMAEGMKRLQEAIDPALAADPS